MKAWIAENVGAPLSVTDIPVPEPQPDQVVIEVKAAGICHSDVGIIHGMLPLPLPLVLGHEAAGNIVALGSAVTGYAVGDAVVSAVSGTDAPGITRDGAFAEFTTLTASALVPIPTGVSWAQAAAATDAGATSYTATILDGGVSAGDRVAVIGLGGLGLTGARMCVVAGAEVVGVEPRTEVWESARALGVTRIVADVSEIAGEDFDVVVDFAGVGSTTTGALQAVRARGRVVLVGLGAPDVQVNGFELVGKALTLQGSTPVGDPDCLRAVLEMIASGDLSLPVHEIGFDEIGDGIDRLTANQVSGRLVAML